MRQSEEQPGLLPGARPRRHHSDGGGTRGSAGTYLRASLEEEDPLFDMEMPDSSHGRRTVSWDGASTCESVEDALAALNIAQRGKFLSRLLGDVKAAEKSSAEALFPRRVKAVGQRLSIQGYRVLMRSRKGGGTLTDCMTNMPHQYLVVQARSLSKEFIVDISFKSHFAIMNPPDAYAQLLQKVPEIFAGTREMLESIASRMACEMKGAFSKIGHSVPPWREKNSVLSKWKQEGCQERNLSMEMCNSPRKLMHDKPVVYNSIELGTPEHGLLIPASRLPSSEKLHDATTKKALFTG